MDFCQNASTFYTKTNTYFYNVGVMNTDMDQITYPTEVQALFCRQPNAMTQFVEFYMNSNPVKCSKHSGEVIKNTGYNFVCILMDKCIYIKVFIVLLSLTSGKTISTGTCAILLNKTIKGQKLPNNLYLLLLLKYCFKVININVSGLRKECRFKLCLSIMSISKSLYHQGLSNRHNTLSPPPSLLLSIRSHCMFFPRVALLKYTQNSFSSGSQAASLERKKKSWKRIGVSKDTICNWIQQVCLCHHHTTLLNYEGVGTQQAKGQMHSSYKQVPFVLLMLLNLTCIFLRVYILPCIFSPPIPTDLRGQGLRGMLLLQNQQPQRTIRVTKQKEVFPVKLYSRTGAI